VVHIGFTGTRHGMTSAQLDALITILSEEVPSADDWIAHHGDCIGADAQFHQLVRKYDDTAWDANYPECCRNPTPHSVIVVGHPPIDDSRRAFCDFDALHDPRPFMERNRAIVEASDLMIATPREASEQPRGGTWGTIRIARTRGKPLALLLPDGTICRERWKRLDE
jgi:hypothetical protein